MSAAVGRSEASEELDRLERWGAVWESVYADPHRGARPGDADRDFAGWISSFTDEPIAPAEMREWLGHTVARITELGPRAVVDVGVGVGLFLRALAPRVERYLGLDLSASALAAAAASVEGAVGSTFEGRDGSEGRISLVQGDAGRLAELPAGAGDTVLFNSVVQYFPGLEYLERAIEEAARIVGPRGAVFVGDVRHADLLFAFHADVQLRRSQGLLPARELAEQAAARVAEERELCLPPGWFDRLADRLEGVGWVELTCKRGAAENELTCFRYDVVLHGRDRARPPSGLTLPWADLVGPLPPRSAHFARAAVGAIDALLDASDRPAVLTVTGVPNRRLLRATALADRLSEPGDATAWDLERALWAIDRSTASAPDELIELGERRGYAVRLSLGDRTRLDRLDVAFVR